MRRCWLFLGLAGLLVGGLTAAAPPDSADDLQHNRRLLEKWRHDPEHYARLEEDLRAFWALPAGRQRRLRRLDRDLHETDPHTRKRLWGVLERYHAWLERLPESQQESIRAAPDARERLRLVKEIRDQQWLASLPRAVREDLLKLPADQRPARVALLRQEERRHREEWPRPPRPGKAPRVDDLGPEVRAYVNETLLPRLSADERERLRKAEGKWPALGRTLLGLSDAHPFYPPLPGGPVTHVKDLPPEARRLLRGSRAEHDGPVWQAAHKHQGKWPDFALAFADFYKHQKVPPLGASRPKELPQPTYHFLTDRLGPLLSKAEREHLAGAEGKWPEYPRTLLDLARKHRLGVPGMTLPGPRDWWESSRPGGPKMP